MMHRSTGVFRAAAALLAVLAAPFALAHGLGVWAEVDGPQVLVEAYFTDGKAVRAGKVRVTDASGALVAEGALSSAGKWSFPVPSRPKVLIHVEAGEAHTADYELEITSGSQK